MIKNHLALACVLFCAILALAGEPALELSLQEKKLLDLTNAERKKANVPPLTATRKLFQAARDHSRRMAKEGRLDHVLAGKNPGDRIRATGYKFRTAGENIACRPADVPIQDVFKGWMDSKIHRENLLSPEFTEIGLGIASDPTGGVFYTQVFARP
jgi:uncharacterized protein YkwD